MHIYTIFYNIYFINMWYKIRNSNYFFLKIFFLQFLKRNWFFSKYYTGIWTSDSIHHGLFLWIAVVTFYLEHMYVFLHCVSKPRGKVITEHSKRVNVHCHCFQVKLRKDIACFHARSSVFSSFLHQWTIETLPFSRIRWKFQRT